MFANFFLFMITYGEIEIKVTSPRSLTKDDIPQDNFTSDVAYLSIYKINGIDEGIIEPKFSQICSLYIYGVRSSTFEIPRYFMDQFINLERLHLVSATVSARQFVGFDKLQWVHLDQLIIPEGLFSGCKSLTDFKSSDSIQKFEEYCFNGTSLKEFDFRSCNISDFAFENCTYLKQISFRNTSIGKSFYGCTNLKNVTLLNYMPLNTEFTDKENMTLIITGFETYGNDILFNFSGTNRWSGLSIMGADVDCKLLEYPLDLLEIHGKSNVYGYLSKTIKIKHFIGDARINPSPFRDYMKAEKFTIESNMDNLVKAINPYRLIHLEVLCTGAFPIDAISFDDFYNLKTVTICHDSFDLFKFDNALKMAGKTVDTLQILTTQFVFGALTTKLSFSTVYFNPPNYQSVIKYAFKCYTLKLGRNVKGMTISRPFEDCRFSKVDLTENYDSSMINAFRGELGITEVHVDYYELRVDREVSIMKWHIGPITKQVFSLGNNAKYIYIEGSNVKFDGFAFKRQDISLYFSGGVKEGAFDYDTVGAFNRIYFNNIEPVTVGKNAFNGTKFFPTTLVLNPKSEVYFDEGAFACTNIKNITVNHLCKFHKNAFNFKVNVLNEEPLLERQFEGIKWIKHFQLKTNIVPKYAFKDAEIMTLYLKDEGNLVIKENAFEGASIENFTTPIFEIHDFAFKNAKAPLINVKNSCNISDHALDEINSTNVSVNINYPDYSDEKGYVKMLLRYNNNPAFKFIILGSKFSDRAFEGINMKSVDFNPKLSNTSKYMFKGCTELSGDVFSNKLKVTFRSHCLEGVTVDMINTNVLILEDNAFNGLTLNKLITTGIEVRGCGFNNSIIKIMNITNPNGTAIFPRNPIPAKAEVSINLPFDNIDKRWNNIFACIETADLIITRPKLGKVTIGKYALSNIAIRKIINRDNISIIASHHSFENSTIGNLFEVYNQTSLSMYAFAGCNFPETTYVKKTFSYNFAYTNITTLYITNSFLINKGLLYGMKKLKYLYIDRVQTVFDRGGLGAEVPYTLSLKESYDMSNGFLDVTTDIHLKYYYSTNTCPTFKNFKIVSLELYGPEITSLMKNAFYDCNYPVDLIIKDFSKITSIESRAFDHAKFSENFSMVLNSSIINCDYQSFNGINNLKSLTIATKLVYSGYLYLEMGFNGEKLTITRECINCFNDNNFLNIYGLKELTILDVGNITDMDMILAIDSTNYNYEIVIDNPRGDILCLEVKHCREVSTTHPVTVIPDETFYSKRGISNETLHKYLKTALYIGDHAFAYTNINGVIQFNPNIQYISTTAFIDDSVDGIYMPTNHSVLNGKFRLNKFKYVVISITDQGNMVKSAKNQKDEIGSLPILHKLPYTYGDSYDLIVNHSQNIPNYAFYDFDDFNRYKPTFVPELINIPEGCFSQSHPISVGGLSMQTLVKNAERIGKMAFMNIRNIEREITFTNKTKYIGSKAFEGTNIHTVHVQFSELEEYPDDVFGNMMIDVIIDEGVDYKGPSKLFGVYIKDNGGNDNGSNDNGSNNSGSNNSGSNENDSSNNGSSSSAVVPVVSFVVVLVVIGAIVGVFLYLRKRNSNLENHVEDVENFEDNDSSEEVDPGNNDESNNFNEPQAGEAL